MDIVEARWIRSAIGRFSPEEVSPLLNIGSSTLEFRTRRQPWVTSELMAPLEARGIRIVHCDIKNEPGVDLVADLMTDEGLSRLKAVKPKALLCSNLLEHVPDPHRFAERCGQLISPGGIVIATGPYSYHHHRDPIDTMFRPAPEDAAALFPDCELIEGRILTSGLSYRDRVRAHPEILLHHLLRAPFPMFYYQDWKRYMARLYWLINNYQFFAVLLRKTG